MDGFKSVTLSKKKKGEGGGREPETMKPTLYDSILIPSRSGKRKKNSMRLKTRTVVSSGRRGVLAQMGKRKRSRLILELIQILYILGSIQTLI